MVSPLEGPSSSSSCWPSVIQSVLLKDGRVKTSFNDGTWIVVEPKGSCYTYFSPRGRVPQERRMSSLARHHQYRKLALALDFRNSHTPVPYWCKAVETSLGKYNWHSGIRVESASWILPKDLKYDDAKDSMELKSRDGRCSFHLLSNKLRFTVCFPVLYKTTKQSDSGPVYSYYLQQQHFSSRDCPKQWKALLEGAQEQIECEPDQRRDKILVTDLPQASLGEEAAWIPIEVSSFWDSHKETSYPRDTTVVVEWTPNCLFRFIYDLDEAEILTFFDNSLMVSKGGSSGSKEFEHVSPNALGDRIHRPANRLASKTSLVTLDKISKKSDSIFTFYDSIVNYGSKFLEYAILVKLVIAEKEFKTNSESAPLVSNNVYAEKVHPSIGTMVAFEDKRVWIKFIDKTFLQMDHEHNFCKITLPRGDVRIVRVHKPVGVEDYVHIAREFAAWVFQTPNERDQQIQLYSSVQSQIEASKRMSKMIDWHLGTDAALLV